MKNNNQARFQHSHKSMFIWFICTFLIFGPVLNILRDFTLEGNLLPNINEYSLSSIIVKANSLLSFFLFMFLSYLAFYRFFPTKKIQLVAGILLALALPIAIRFFIDQHLLFWLFGETNYLANTTIGFYFSDNTYFAVYYIPSGILYYFYQRNIALQKARLEAEKLRAEAEITHLRSQVNPHFLFNSLNNIYSLAYDKSDKILGAIEGLSELLRYSLYEKSIFVSFDEEWSKAQQMIIIEQMRLVEPVNFEIEISEDISNISIPPVILLPLIENIFKHGNAQDKDCPPSIKAYLKDRNLIFQAKNVKSTTSQKDNQHGIGLENIKKRLFHIYGDKSSFEVLEKEDTFMAQLSIPAQ